MLHDRVVKRLVWLLFSLLELWLRLRTIFLMKLTMGNNLFIYSSLTGLVNLQPTTNFGAKQDHEVPLFEVLLDGSVDGLKSTAKTHQPFSQKCHWTSSLISRHSLREAIYTPIFYHFLSFSLVFMSIKEGFGLSFISSSIVCLILAHAILNEISQHFGNRDKNIEDILDVLINKSWLFFSETAAFQNIQ